MLNPLGQSRRVFPARAIRTGAAALPLAALLATSCAPHREVAPTTNPATHTAETFFSTEVALPARWLDGVFSHDERILVASDQTGTFNAFALPVDGGRPEQLTHSVDGRGAARCAQPGGVILL